MSVVVENITKIYGEQRAVNEVSFTAKKGEILGLLGPNGAGKTTTMKILTCYLPPNEGSASVNGFDIKTDQLAVRKSIGYLPEHNPLYPEMYVKEILEMVGSVFKVQNLNQRIEEVIELTGLTKEQHKPISALSKGYRQRVGLAQALIHDPEVLILDEPTSGLDPNQLAEIRALIKNLGESKTVIFSSHILQEVQALCDRVVILNNGKIVANDAISNLSIEAQHEDLVRVEFLNKISIEQIQKQFANRRIQTISDKEFEISSPTGQDIRGDIFDFAVAKNNKILSMNKMNVSVEEVFQKLTGDKKEGSDD